MHYIADSWGLFNPLGVNPDDDLNENGFSSDLFNDFFDEDDE
jgi:hypothetical protein